MTRLRWTVPLLLLLAWAAVAWLQWIEYRHECLTARRRLAAQAGDVADALASGIRSHRRPGRLLEEQLRTMLGSVVPSAEILAARLWSEEGGLDLRFGDTATVAVDGEQGWTDGGYRHVSRFVLATDPGPPGRGWGRGRSTGGEATGPMAAGGRFALTVVVSDEPLKRQCRQAAILRLSVAAVAGLAAAFLAAALAIHARLAQSRLRQTALEAEARRLDELGQAAAGLAHETRNPLGLVRGWAQQLADSGLPPDQRQHAEAVVAECDRVAARLNQFLAFARPCEPTLRPLDLSAVAAELATLLAPDLEAHAVTLDAARVPAGALVRADPLLLRQALFNLIQNAIQFSPKAGRVELAYRADERGARLEIADRGPGVAQRQRLFMPYFTTREGGTGLGLAIVAHIAAAHGWSYGYADRPGGGSIFWLDCLQ